MLDEIVTEQLDAPGAFPTAVRCTLESDGFCMIEICGELAPIEPDQFIDNPLTTSSTFFSLTVANAFSECLNVEVNQNGKRWRQSFSAGLATSPLEARATTEDSSFRIRLRPDPTIFKGERVSFLSLCSRAQEWAIFHPLVRFRIEGPDDQRRDYHYPDGLLSYADEVGTYWHGTRLNGPWRCSLAEGTSIVEAILVSHLASEPAVRCYVNGRAIGGNQAKALRAAIKKVAPKFLLDDKTILLSVKIENPINGATRTFLTDDRANRLIRKMITTQLPAEIARVAAERLREK